MRALTAEIWYQAALYQSQNSIQEIQMNLFLRLVVARIASFISDLRGVSTVEYALMVVAVIAAVGLAAGLLGDAFEDLFTDLAKDMTEGIGNVKKAVTS